MDNQEQNIPSLQTENASKKGNYLRIIITSAIFLVLGLLIGYILGKNNPQQPTMTNTESISTPTIVPSLQVSINPVCPPISAGPVMDGNTIEKTLELAGAVKKHQVSVMLPIDWNITIGHTLEDKPCNITAYDIKSKDNKSLLKIVYSGEAVGWPLPTNAVSIKKIDSEEEIIRYYGNEEDIDGYFYHTNKVQPKTGDEDFQMSSGFVLKNGNRVAVLDVYLIFSGSENEKNAALQIADKIVSSLSLK